MKISLSAAAGDAWTMFKRDREVLIALAGMFLFLPTLATLLLLPAPPKPPPLEAAKPVLDAWADQYAHWLTSNFPLMAGAALVGMLGSLAIIGFYADRARPDVGAAIAGSLRRLPAFFLQTLIVSTPATLGVLGVLVPGLFILALPGLWILGRGLLAGVVLVGEGLGPIASIRRSFRLTRGNDLTYMGLAAISAFGGQVLAAPFLAVDQAMRDAHSVNPVALIISDVGAAVAATIVALGMLLLRVAIYRRVGDGSSNGI